MQRRGFIKLSSLSVIAGNLASLGCATSKNMTGSVKPVVLSTWDFGKKANAAAWQILNTGGQALDAVEQGVMDAESDPTNQSVGLGGRPDRDGHVTLDACIMDDKNRAGSVTCLEHILHPVSVARRVMEKTPHVILTGDGALQFALQEGFNKTNLLTEKSKSEWQTWLKDSKYQPIINVENHDTIGMIALDKAGNLSGACTTSGLSYKMHGRVGDSPIIGAGLYVDNKYGAAVCTGVGEYVLRNLSSFLAVELMRQGKSPQEACEEAIRRIIEHSADLKDIQVGIIALNKKGQTGAYAIQEGFTYALRSPDTDDIKNSTFALEF